MARGSLSGTISPLLRNGERMGAGRGAQVWIQFGLNSICVRGLHDHHHPFWHRSALALAPLLVKSSQVKSSQVKSSQKEPKIDTAPRANALGVGWRELQTLPS